MVGLGSGFEGAHLKDEEKSHLGLDLLQVCTRCHTLAWATVTLDRC